MGTEMIYVNIEIDTSNIKKAIGEVENAFDRLRKAIESPINTSSILIATTSILDFSSALHGVLYNSEGVYEGWKQFGDLFLKFVLNPFTLAISAVAVFGLLVAGLASVFAKGTPDMKAFSSEIKAQGDATKELIKQYDELKERSKQKNEATSLEISYVNGLKDRLSELIDAKGKVKKGHEEEAELILKELNPALGTNYELNGRNIEQYGKLEKNISKSIEQKQSELIQGNLVNEIRETALKRLEAESLYKEQEILLNQALADNSVFSAMEIAHSMEALADTIEECTIKEVGLRETMKQARDSDLRDTMAFYEEQVIKAKTSNDNISLERRREIEEIKKTNKEKLDEYTKSFSEVSSETDNFYWDMTTKGNEFGKSNSKQATQIGKDMPSYFSEGVYSANQTAFDSIAKTGEGVLDAAYYVFGMNSPSSIFFDIGANIVNSAATGVAKNKTGFIESVTSTFKTMVSKVKGLLGISSPSTVFMSIGGSVVDGFVKGVKDNSNLAVEAVSDMFEEIASLSPYSHYGLDGINTVVLPSIPRLAKGMVIPANSEFLAVLGDQKYGRNIETPESLLRDILREEGFSGKEIVIINKLYLDGKEVAEIVNRQNGKLSFVKNGRN